MSQLSHSQKNWDCEFANEAERLLQQLETHSNASASMLTREEQAANDADENSRDAVSARAIGRVQLRRRQHANEGEREQEIRRQNEPATQRQKTTRQLRTNGIAHKSREAYAFGIAQQSTRMPPPYL